MASPGRRTKVPVFKRPTRPPVGPKPALTAGDGKSGKVRKKKVL